MRAPLRVRRVLLLIETSRVYGRRIAEGVGRYAREHGPWSFYVEERGLDELSLAKLDRWQVDGAISRIRSREGVRFLLRAGLPVVDLLGDPAIHAPDIVPDDNAICRMAVGHLLDQGLRQLAFFASSEDWWIRLRRLAFAEEVRRGGMACSCYSCPPGQKGDDWPRQQSAVGRWLLSLPTPVGVFCATDLHALRLLDTCREVGLAVPEQVAVLGVDNDPLLCTLAWPPLSSIDLDPQRIGYDAAALLDKRMASKRSSRGTIRMPPRDLVARESTDVLAIADAAVVRAVRFIRQSACKGIGVPHVVDQAAMSRRALEQRFRSALGRTPKQEILRVKIEKAKSLLARSDHALKRVADLAGFGSLHHFAKAFRRVTGHSPGEFRRRKRLWVQSG